MLPQKKVLPLSDDMTAGKLVDSALSVRSYNEQVLRKVKNLYLKRKINHYEYSHLVTILTCMNLTIDDMKTKLNTFIDQKDISIDIRI